MKMKSVTLEEYFKSKEGNENKSYGELIDIAWENSEERMKQKLYGDTIFLLVAFCGASYVFAKTPDLFLPMPLSGDNFIKELRGINNILSKLAHFESMFTVIMSLI